MLKVGSETIIYKETENVKSFERKEDEIVLTSSQIEPGRVSLQSDTLSNTPNWQLSSPL